jgi:hypothetical protein
MQQSFAAVSLTSTRVDLLKVLRLLWSSNPGKVREVSRLAADRATCYHRLRPSHRVKNLDTDGKFAFSRHLLEVIGHLYKHPNISRTPKHLSNEARYKRDDLLPLSRFRPVTGHSRQSFQFKQTLDPTLEALSSSDRACPSFAVIPRCAGSGEKSLLCNRTTFPSVPL